MHVESLQSPKGSSLVQKHVIRRIDRKDRSTSCFTQLMPQSYASQKYPLLWDIYISM